MASAAATRGLPKLAAYGAAKAGVAGLVRGLAAELAGTGITANAVCPGSTDTAMLAESARLYDLAGTDPFADQQPVGRLLRPDEVAAALVWLAEAEPWRGHRRRPPGGRRPHPVTAGADAERSPTASAWSSTGASLRVPGRHRPGRRPARAGS